MSLTQSLRDYIGWESDCQLKSTKNCIKLLLKEEAVAIMGRLAVVGGLLLSFAVSHPAEKNHEQHKHVPEVGIKTHRAAYRDIERFSAGHENLLPLFLDAGRDTALRRNKAR